MKKSERQIEVLLKGPAVEGRVSVDYLATLAKELQSTLRRIAQNRPSGRGRFGSGIEQACQLDFVSFRKSSALLGFELSGSPDETLFGEIGSDALATLMDAIERSHEGNADWAAELPQSALDGLGRIVRPLDNGIVAIQISTKGKNGRTVKIDREFSTRLRNAVTVEHLPGFVRVTGVVWEADWKKHTAELYEPNGNMVPLTFEPERDEDITAARRCSVIVSGIGHHTGGRLQKIDVRHIETIGPPAVDQTATEFWSNPTIDELAQQQSVSVIEDLERLRGDWPDEDSIDDFLESLRRTRI